MPFSMSDMFDIFANLVGGREKALEIVARSPTPDAFASEEGVGSSAAAMYRAMYASVTRNVAAQAGEDAGVDVAGLGAADLGGAILGGAIAGGLTVAGVLLWDLAGGVPETQVPTLPPGTTWNPAGDPGAPNRLANDPRQVISVANETQLISAIDQVNASPGNYTIDLTASIVLTGDLPPIAQPTGSVLINGEGHLLYGSNAYGGLVVNGTRATIRNLMIQDFAANGSQGSSQGEGGGLVAINGAQVVVDNVTLADDSAPEGSNGAGLGGAYADPSSSIVMRGSSISGNGASGRQGDGIAVSLSGNLAVTTAMVKKGQTTTLNGGGVADQGGTGDIDALVAKGGGTVVLTGTESFSGGVVVMMGTTVELADLAAASSGNITFASQGTGTLRIDPTALDINKAIDTRLSGMSAGDRVDLVGLSGATQVSVGLATASTAGNGEPVTAVTVSNGTQSETLLFQGLNPDATFTTASDGHGGTMLRMTQAVPTPTDLSGQTSQAGVVTFSGMGQPGSTVTLYQMQPGTLTLLQLGTATVGADGQFTLTPGTQPDAGGGPVRAVATDSYGNTSLFSKRADLPAGVGGQAPAIAHGMVAPTALSIVVRVGTEEQLIAAINEANANNSGLALAIQFTNNITLSGTADLPVLEDGSAVQIVGNGYTLQGDGETRGLMLFGADATIDNLTISDMVAKGGSGGFGASGGGGGGGLGGGLMVAGASTVTLDNVNFVDDRAVGGAGGESGGTGGGSGGGGGIDGDGGSAQQGTSMDISGGGGGVGNQATGGGDDTAAGAGTVAGAPSDQSNGAAGDVDGGGGASGSATPGGNGANLDGEGGGIDGNGSTGGSGGGGGGNDQLGGDGGFGGGGGGSTYQGGHGGFAGGGGGGAPLRSHTGEPGGFAAGSGGPGTNNSTDSGGGGGGALGGAVFVAQGAKVTVENSSSSGDSVQGGQGQDGGQNGRAYGSGWFFQGNQSVTFKAQAGQTTTINDSIADETGSHDQSGAQGSLSLIVEGKGTVVLDASNTYSGGTMIDGGHLEIGSAGGAGSGNITFAGRSGTLEIDPAAIQEHNVIVGFSHNDSIDLAGIAWSRDTSATVLGTTKTPAGMVTVVGISDPGGQQQQLLFKGLSPHAAFVTSSDGQGGTKLTLAPSSGAAAASGGLAGHVCGSSDVRSELSAALERTSPAPGVVPEGDRGGGSAGAGREPTPEGGMVPLPGAEEHHAIASADHGSQGDTSGSHHTR